MRAVDNVNFAVERGELFALLGPNGAGKGTCNVQVPRRSATLGVARPPRHNHLGSSRIGDRRSQVPLGATPDLVAFRSASAGHTRSLCLRRLAVRLQPWRPSSWIAGAGVLTVTLNRPERLNAAPVRMWRELTEVFTEARLRSDDRVVVVTGAGGAFCAGADLSEIRGR